MVCMYSSKCKSLRSQGGFSLITVAIGLAIIGIIMIPAIQIYNIKMASERQNRNEISVALASSAINKYFLIHGEYPIPASPDATLESTEYGRSASMPAGGWPNCQDPSTPNNVVCETTIGTNGSQPVLIGTVPFADAKIPISAAMDFHKNQLTYAVTKALTRRLDFTENGGRINVNNADGLSIYAAGIFGHFVVVNHGDDRRGAYGQNGIRNVACGTDANSLDFENCNRDGLFRNNTRNVPNLGVRTIINDSTAGASHFDDFVAERSSSASGIWSYVPNPTTPDLSIKDRMGGNVAVGVCESNPCIPRSRLDIYRGTDATLTPVVRADRVKTSRFCSRGTVNVSTATPRGDPTGDGFNCVSDYTSATNVAGTELITSCEKNGVCPAITAVWNNNNIPPWFTPKLIVGTPSSLGLTESGPYWIPTPNVANPPNKHDDFHRGNGILCVGNRGLNGIFDYDESCNRTSYVDNTTVAGFTPCPAGSYARGIKSNANGKPQPICQTTVQNSIPVAGP